mmetsp:Transcript_60295/g.107519  ORF Transcript_60295/g.107519 Transcript_60295/m.107519 type:complete len:116 (-) Transcript_60295:380-727(-)
MGFAGLVCMRSGNVEEHDCRLYMRCGAHVVVGKDVPLKEASNIIRRNYVHRFMRPTSPGPVSTHVLPAHDTIQDSTDPCQSRRQAWSRHDVPSPHHQGRQCAYTIDSNMSNAREI